MGTKNSFPILIKLAIGKTTDTQSQEHIYGDWKVVYIKSQQTGGLDKTNYGFIESYDLVINLDSNSVTRQIDATTLFLINEMPTSNFELGNYEVAKIFPPANGLIKIGLVAKGSEKFNKIYYKYNDMVISYQLNLDYKTLIGYIPADKTIPFNINSILWKTKPIDVNQVNNRIKLIAKSKTGVDKTDKRFYKLTFGVV